MSKALAMIFSRGSRGNARTFHFEKELRSDRLRLSFSKCKRIVFLYMRIDL